jgi:hypothetical protein
VGYLVLPAFKPFIKMKNKKGQIFCPLNFTKSFFALLYYFRIRTKYVTANMDAIAKIVSNPGDLGCASASGVASGGATSSTSPAMVAWSHCH